jgi:hypothetical protein
MTDQLQGIVISAALAALLLIASACRSGEVVRTETARPAHEVLAIEKYGPGFESVYNRTKTAVLCVKRSKPTQLEPQQRVSFFVYDVNAGSIIFEDEIPNGSVLWNDESSVLVTVVPGTVKSEDQSSPSRPGYIYEVLLKKARGIDSVKVR